MNTQIDFNTRLHNHITKRYVVTDTLSLISPKGFSCDFPVMQKTKIFLQFDKVPTKKELQHIKSTLILHDTKELKININQKFNK